MIEKLKKWLCSKGMHKWCQDFGERRYQRGSGSIVIYWTSTCEWCGKHDIGWT